jgi:hypothetical protein
VPQRRTQVQCAVDFSLFSTPKLLRLRWVLITASTLVGVHLNDEDPIMQAYVNSIKARLAAGACLFAVLLAACGGCVGGDQLPL